MALILTQNSCIIYKLVYDSTLIVWIQTRGLKFHNSLVKYRNPILMERFTSVLSISIQYVFIWNLYKEEWHHLHVTFTHKITEWINGQSEM